MSNTTKKNLIEVSSLVAERNEGKDSFKIRIIDEGQGSSGFYSADLLEKYYHVFEGVLSFKNHPTGWDGPESRDLTMIAGRIGSVWTERDEKSGKVGIYGDFTPDPEYADKIERYKDALGVSIYTTGESYVDDYGVVRVETLEKTPFTSADIVIAAGRGGSLSLGESLRETLEKYYYFDSTENRNNRKEAKMDLENLAAKLDALTTTVLALASDKEAEASESAQAKADEEAVAKAVESYAAKVEAIAKAELPAVLAESLRKDALAGADVEVKITEAKALTEALKTELTESGAGRVIEGSDDDYTLKGFGGK